MFGYWNTCFRQHPVNEDLDIIDRTMFSYFCAMYLKRHHKIKAKTRTFVAGVLVFWMFYLRDRFL